MGVVLKYGSNIFGSLNLAHSPTNDCNATASKRKKVGNFLLAAMIFRDLE